MVPPEVGSNETSAFHAHIVGAMESSGRTAYAQSMLVRVGRFIGRRTCVRNKIINADGFNCKATSRDSSAWPAREI